MTAELKALGIDLAKVPALKDIPLANKKKLMPLFQKALGMESCDGCHADGDFKAETTNIKMSRMMWQHYVQGLNLDKKADPEGKGLFCDSCHHGNSHMLPRKDHAAVESLMSKDYMGKLSRVDGKEHDCASCHTESMQYDIFEDVWGIK